MVKSTFFSHNERHVQAWSTAGHRGRRNEYPPSTENPGLTKFLSVNSGVSQTIKFPLTIKNPELSNVLSVEYGENRTIKFLLY